MLARTDHEPHARWHLIEAESKRYARVKVIETVIAEIEAGHAPPRVRAAAPESGTTAGRTLCRRLGPLARSRRRRRSPATTMSAAPARASEDPVVDLVGVVGAAEL